MGATLLLLGIILGNLFPTFSKRPKQIIQHFISKKAQIVDISPPIDLGE